MRMWLYDFLVEPFAVINIVTEDCGPKFWRRLGWRPTSRL